MPTLLPPLPATVRTLTTEQSQRLTREYGRLPTVDRCITCHGSKSFRWYRDGSRDPADVVDYTCDCPSQFILSRRLLHSGIHESYQRLGWADAGHIADETLAQAIEYLDHYREFMSAGYGIILWGSKGNGKTMLGHLILKTLIGHGADVYASTFTALLDAYAGGWKDKADRIWFDQRIRNADALLVDDLGRERNKGEGSLGEAALEEVIRHRVARSKPTFVTTNVSPDQVEQGYGGHTMSLLSERSSMMHFVGRDWRGAMRQRTFDEAVGGLTRPIQLGDL